ncbi:transketolase family protein [Streptomyces sp. NPDC048594]|uniref:transketolase family protein n=1 Tax=Streptomyces sp. NPDC048594 TaxID=3365575 RepID=UPI00371DFC8D
MAEPRAADGVGNYARKASSCREAWSLALESVAARDDRVVVLVNDSIGSAGLGRFVRRFPDRVVDVGIAEQNLVSVAAGLALAGRTVFVSSASSFLARALEQIKIDVAYAQADVKLVGQSPGVGYGPLGPTHHAIEDITWMSALPGLPVIAPSNPAETAAAVAWAASRPGCAYLRIPRKLYGTPVGSPDSFTYGQATTVRAGRDVTLVSAGATVGLALAAAEDLAVEGVDARVVAMSTVRPLDSERLLDAATTTAGIVTVEDGLVTGLGGAVAAFLSERCPSPVRRIGFRDAFAGVGDDHALLEQAGIGVAGIAAAARSLLTLVPLPGRALTRAARARARRSAHSRKAQDR